MALFRIAKRVFLFAILNILVIITLSITLNILGIKGYLTNYGIDYYALMVFCLIWGMGGAFISLMLSRIMAKWMMGVHVIDPDTRDPGLRWLIDTVYKLSRQAGLDKMPEVGIYESREINAFATGPTRNRALVAVSSGLLENMSEEEIEGVIAHEVSHISNGDMVTMTLLQGVINAIVMFLARVIAFAVTSRRDGDRDSSPFMRYVITVMLEIALSFLGMILLAWFSRFREFKADEGGAKLAGKEKMIAALERLKRTIERADLTQVESVKAFKISSKSSFFHLFATHPPLEDRINRLKELY
ncbi:MAG TPA: protease HtpX [Elusimicrobiales bacterium]|nr:protease HtpX [Elusimicrobiales bacterium]HOL62812.1 protease HtpX [Elusimicrobiales bacterium]HPO95752.1 protease HtpX [Elusimicrobiales bacterium]